MKDLFPKKPTLLGLIVIVYWVTVLKRYECIELGGTAATVVLYHFLFLLEIIMALINQGHPHIYGMGKHLRKLRCFRGLVNFMV